MAYDTGIFQTSDIALLEHNLLYRVYVEGGFDNSTEYIEGVLDMTQKIIEVINKEE